MNIMLCPPDPCHHDDCCGDYGHFEPLLSTIGVGPRGPKGEKGDPGVNGVSGDYAGLINKPSINGVQISGSLSFANIGLNAITNQEINDLF